MANPSELFIEDYESWCEGDITVSSGVVTPLQPKLYLPQTHTLWDRLADSLPDLMSSLGLIRAVDEMDMLPADETVLDSQYLSRAAVILGAIAHGYHYICEYLLKEPRELPESIVLPWKQVCNRLGRPATARTMQDASYYNWRFVDPSAANPMRFDNLTLLVPVFDDETERLTNLVVTLMDYHFAPAIQAIISAQENMLYGRIDEVVESLDAILATVKSINMNIFGLLSTSPFAKEYMDPVTWSITFAKYVGSTRPDEPNLSAAVSPMFHFLDAFLGRKKYTTEMGRQQRDKLKMMPLQQIALLEAIESGVSLRSFYDATSNEIIGEKLDQILHAYAGENGLIARHKLRAFDYIELGSRAGRTVTNGKAGSAKSPNFQLSHVIDKQLQEGIDERLAIASNTPINGYISDIEIVGKDTKRIQISSHSQLLNYQVGDYCMIYPQRDNGSLAEPRYYSVASMPSHNKIEVTIKKIFHPRYGQGLASGYMHSLEVGDAVSFKLASGINFRLPKDYIGPLLCIAGGVGVSPFRSFILQRLNMGIRDNTLLFAVRNPSELFYLDEWQSIADLGYLELATVISSKREIFIYASGDNQYKQAYTDSERMLHHLLMAYNQKIHDILTSDGYILVCGSPSFGEAVLNHFQSHCSDINISEKVILGKYQQEVFSGHEDVECQRFITASELSIHNTTQLGIWTAIDGNVYDLSCFIGMHPGGDKIIRAYAGLEASDDYGLVHGGSHGIDAWLSSFKIGEYKGYEHFHNDELSIWTNLLTNIVKLENDLVNNTHFPRQKIKVFHCMNVVSGFVKSMYDTLGPIFYQLLPMYAMDQIQIKECYDDIFSSAKEFEARLTSALLNSASTEFVISAYQFIFNELSINVGKLKQQVMYAVMQLEKKCCLKDANLKVLNIIDISTSLISDAIMIYDLSISRSSILTATSSSQIEDLFFSAVGIDSSSPEILS